MNLTHATGKRDYTSWMLTGILRKQEELNWQWNQENNEWHPISLGHCLTKLSLPCQAFDVHTDKRAEQKKQLLRMSEASTHAHSRPQSHSA